MTLMPLLLLLTFGGVTSAASSRAGAAFQALAKHRSCGACLRHGGAWCLEAERCVPDGRGLCGEGSSPADHVGWAGHGRCPDPADWQLQTYLHAPRRPPPKSLQSSAPPPSCAAECAQLMKQQQGRKGPLLSAEEAAEQFERCGLLLLPRLFDPAAIQLLRMGILGKMHGNGSAPAYGHKLELPGVRGSRRQELVVPFKLAEPVLGALRQPAVYAVLHAVLGHAPALDFVSVVAAWPGASAQAWHRDVEPATEAAALVFIPLDPTSSDTGRGLGGPPEMW
jgi:hypothetical protein